MIIDYGLLIMLYWRI